MEPTPDRTSSSNDMAAPERQLPHGRGTVGRIADHTRGLVDDLKMWTELRLKLAQIEFEERLDAKVNQLAVAAVIGVLFALAGLFLLLTIAFLLGWALGNTFWGFLIVAGVLALTAVVVQAAKPRLLKIGAQRARLDAEKVSRGRPAAERPASQPRSNGRRNGRRDGRRS